MKLARYFCIAAFGAVLALDAGAQSPSKDPRPTQGAAPGRDRPAPIVITAKPRRAGNFGTTATDRMKQRDERAKYLQELSKKRVSGGARLQGLAIYQPKDGGTPMLTNRIAKYDARSDYTRIKFKYDPRIVKPTRWGATKGHLTNTEIHKYVEHYANLYGIDASLIHAVIWAESRGNPYAVSPKGARGLMQLMPGTASDMNVVDVFDPAENIGGGTQYLSKLLSFFNGRFDLALAGYNAGPETVRQYGGIPPYRETQAYVVKVLAAYSDFKSTGNAFDYVSYNPDLSPAALEARRAERMTTHELGDVTKTVHDILLAGGEVQAADRVHFQGEYLYVTAGDRTLRLRAEQVQSVDGMDPTPNPVLTPAQLEAVPDATVPLPDDPSVQLAAQI